MKLVAQINAETRKATVSIDGGAPVVCSLKKEGNGTYSIVLKGKVEWPNSYMNIGNLESREVVVDSESLKQRTKSTESKSNAPKTLIVGNISSRLERDIEVLKNLELFESDEEREIFEKVYKRAKYRDEIKATDDKIAALTAQIEALKKERAAYGGSKDDEQVPEETNEADNDEQ